MEKKRIEKAYIEAEMYADSLPEKYRNEAFEVLFSKLLKVETQHLEISNEGTKDTSDPNVAENESQAAVIDGAKIDFSDLYDAILSGNYETRAAVILHRVGEHGFSQSLSVSEIASIMVKKLSIPKVDTPNLRRALNKSRLFLKNSENGVYRYSLSLYGKEWLKDALKSQG